LDNYSLGLLIICIATGKITNNYNSPACKGVHYVIQMVVRQQKEEEKRNRPRNGLSGEKPSP
jgi:hypothetical protein